MEDTIVLEREPVQNEDEINLTQEVPIDELSIPSTVPQRPRFRRPAPRASPAIRNESMGGNPHDSIGMDAFVNPNKQAEPMMPPEDDAPIDYGDGPDLFDDDGPAGYNDGGGGGYGGGDIGEEEINSGYRSIEEEKADLLNKLERLRKKGHNINGRLTAYSDVRDIRSEYNRIKYAIDAEQAVRFSRRMLVACVTGLEFMNKRYDPLALQLEGWSESIMENIDDYDGVFEELYAKYKTKVEVAPEIRLIMMLGGSATMFHLTNSMFKSAIPNVNDVLKQNPDLLRNMVSAVQTTAQNGRMPSGGGVVPPTERPVTPVGTDGRREMQGPGFDLSSLMGGISMPPPPPVNTSSFAPPAPPAPEDYQPTLDEIQQAAQNVDDDLSDIVSVSGESTQGETKDINVKKPAKTRKPRKKKADKKEISL